MTAVADQTARTSRLPALMVGDVDRNGEFLPWIDHLFEVGERVRRLRAKALETATEAVVLEQHALGLRRHVHAACKEIDAAVERNWTAAEVSAARQCAELRSVHLLQLRAVDSAALARELAPLDGTHLASEAITAFSAVALPEPGAPEDEVRAALERVRQWWLIAGAPVAARAKAVR